MPRCADASTTAEAAHADTGQDETAVGEGGSPARSSRPRCSNLPGPLYIAGTSTVRPLLAAAAQALSYETATPPLTLVYQQQPACATLEGLARDAPLVATSDADGASYWDLTESALDRREKRCELEPAGAAADLGVSDVFATSCQAFPQGLPDTVVETLGAIEPLVFVAPEGSSQRTISADAAYMVFGWGKGSGVEPWTDEAGIVRESGASGTQALAGAIIGVPAERWRGAPSNGPEAIALALLGASTDAARSERAIGVLPTHWAERYRGRLRALAFQDRGQACASLPDSSAPASAGETAKQNVRDGHYTLWGRLHFVTRTANPARSGGTAAATVVDYLTGAKALPGPTTMVAVAAANGLIPECAMRVTRGAEGGPLTPYQPAEPCGCYFEEQLGSSPTCRPCSAALECPPSRSHCSFGYCEP